MLEPGFAQVQRQLELAQLARMEVAMPSVGAGDRLDQALFLIETHGAQGALGEARHVPCGQQLVRRADGLVLLVSLHGA